MQVLLHPQLLSSYVFNIEHKGMGNQHNIISNKILRSKMQVLKKVTEDINIYKHLSVKTRRFNV